MRIDKNQVAELNAKAADGHTNDFNYIADKLTAKGHDVDSLLEKIGSLKIATPSWALGTGATRFGRFPGGGEPATIEQKIEDISVLADLSNQTDSVSLHIPWDIPSDPAALREFADNCGIRFDAMNSNTFQDQSGATESYKFGSLCHSDANVRKYAVDHNIECIEIGKELGSNVLTVWLADGSTFPGQANFMKQFDNTLDSLKAIYAALPEDWMMFTEHKPFEPNFYSSVVNDWGSSLSLAQKTGERCLCLVDLGHHLPNTNIEQVVSRVLAEGRLGGFHFNDSKYADDDLTVGCMKPYQLYLIFLELVDFMEGDHIKNPDLAFMIDASHNFKDPLEDLLQSLEAIALSYAQALVMDRDALTLAQDANDVALTQEIVQCAYRADLRALVAESRRRAGKALSPIQAYREIKVREQLIGERGMDSQSSGL
ncbi:MAG: sugar isomerase [Lentisphaeria bacterium]|nr:TIM barrel protein [Lentisphaeria bacterium]NQZ71283.1 sugar isomerase [Lentisphaeria bacterium]